MLKGLMMTSLLVVGTTAQASVESSAIHKAADPISHQIGATGVGCHGRSNASLLGTLQIDDRVQPAEQGGPEMQIDQKPATTDCALA